MPLLKEIAGRFKQRSFFGLCLSAFNRILVPLFGASFYVELGVSRQKLSMAKKVFGKSVLKEGEHFFYLEPSPRREVLDDYYKTVYWSSRGGIRAGVNVRDLIHLSILEKHIGNELVPGASFLNFGSGHGGISHLLWRRGLDIRHVDPSLSSVGYSERFRTNSMIEEVPDGTVDIIYGSHSLEHVHDIEFFMGEVARVLKPSASMFWEVPNCEISSQQRKAVPHTYYFRRSFFESWFAQTIVLDSFWKDWEVDIDRWELARSPSGTVLRALGKLRK